MGEEILFRGRVREGRDAVERALALPDPPTAARAAALWGLGIAQWYQADMDGDNTYTATFQVPDRTGLHHVGVNALSHGTLFDGGR